MNRINIWLFHRNLQGCDLRKKSSSSAWSHLSLAVLDDQCLTAKMSSDFLLHLCCRGPGNKPAENCSSISSVTDLLEICRKLLDSVAWSPGPAPWPVIPGASVELEILRAGIACYVRIFASVLPQVLQAELETIWEPTWAPAASEQVLTSSSHSQRESQPPGLKHSRLLLQVWDRGRIRGELSANSEVRLFFSFASRFTSWVFTDTQH